MRILKYRGYLSRQVVFCLAIDVSLLKSEREMQILAKSVDFHADFADFGFLNYRFWILNVGFRILNLQILDFETVDFGF